MADTNILSLPQSHEQNFLHALDPISLILNQNSQNSDHPFPLRLTSLDSFIMERGPNYTAYAELREARLHTKCLMQEQQEPQELEQPTTKLAATTTPPRKKHVKFEACVGNSKGSSFVVAQSVPDFSAALRKENRKPVNNTLPSSMMEMTPPFKRGGNSNGVLVSSRGSKSASGGEKKKGCGGGGAMVARKSYACMDELKSLSSAMATAINGEGRGGGGGGKSSRVIGKTVSSHHNRLF